MTRLFLENVDFVDEPVEGSPNVGARALGGVVRYG